MKVSVTDGFTLKIMFSSPIADTLKLKKVLTKFSTDLLHSTKGNYEIDTENAIYNIHVPSNFSSIKIEPVKYKNAKTPDGAEITNKINELLQAAGIQVPESFVRNTANAFIISAEKNKDGSAHTVEDMYPARTAGTRAASRYLTR